jgi:hypothetical protein
MSDKKESTVISNIRSNTISGKITLLLIAIQIRLLRILRFIINRRK